MKSIIVVYAPIGAILDYLDFDGVRKLITILPKFVLMSRAVFIHGGSAFSIDNWRIHINFDYIGNLRQDDRIYHYNGIYSNLYLNVRKENANNTNEKKK